MSFVLLADVLPESNDDVVRSACCYTARCLFFCHISKAPLDVCKMMYGAHALYDPTMERVRRDAPWNSSGSERGYRPIHSVVQHPVTKWLCESPHNWAFMCIYGREVFEEFDRRRGARRSGKKHMSRDHFEWLCRNPPRFGPPHCRTIMQRTPIPICVEPWIEALDLGLERSYWLHYIQKEYELDRAAHALETAPTPRPLRLEDPTLCELFRKHCPTRVKHAFKRVEDQHAQCHQTCVRVLEDYDRHAARGETRVPFYLQHLRPYAVKKIRRFNRQYLLGDRKRNTRIVL